MKAPIIVALDPSNNEKPINWCKKIVLETREYVIGYKIGLPLLIRTGIERLHEISSLIRDCELRIADLKLGDIGDIMISTIKPLVNIGFNTFIAHGFIGLEEGLIKLSNYLKKVNARLVTIISMSHPGSKTLLDRNYETLFNIAIEADSWGVVVGATKPELIKTTRDRIKDMGLDMKILAPGIGVQGAKPSSAIRAGADYEIIGRMITGSEKPSEKMVELINNYYRGI